MITTIEYNTFITMITTIKHNTFTTMTRLNAEWTEDVQYTMKHHGQWEDNIEESLKY